VPEVVESVPEVVPEALAPVPEVVEVVPEALAPVPLPALSVPEAPVEVEPVRTVVDGVVGRVSEELGDSDDLLAGVVGGGAEPPILEPPLLVRDALDLGAAVVDELPGPLGSAVGDLLPAGDVVEDLLPLSDGSGGLLQLPARLTDLEPPAPGAPVIGRPGPSAGWDAAPAGSPAPPSSSADQPAPTRGAGQGGSVRSNPAGSHSPGRSGHPDAPGRSSGAPETMSVAMAAQGAGPVPGAGAEATDAGLPGPKFPASQAGGPASSPNAGPAGPVPARSQGALPPSVTLQPWLPTSAHLAYTQPGLASAGHAGAGASSGSPHSPEPVTTGSGAASAAAAAATAGLFALLLSLAALGLRYFARLQLAPVRWRPQAFVAVLERPG
jgi:hypothetical protein